MTRRLGRAGGPLLIALAGIGLIVLLVLVGPGLARSVPGWLAALDRLGWWAPAGFVLLYVAATVALAPGSILTIAAGVLFGLVRGSIYVFVGAVLGSAAAFLLARTVARGAVERRVAADPRFAAVDRAIAREGGRLVLLLRLSPIFPFNLLNYALGLTAVSFGQYLAASVGMIPGTVLYVYTGTLVRSLAELPTARAHGGGYYAVLALGLAATLLLTVRLAGIARQALRQSIDADR